MTLNVRASRLAAIAALALVCTPLGCLDEDRSRLSTAPRTTAADAGLLPRLAPGGASPAASGGGAVPGARTLGPAPAELRARVGSRLRDNASARSAASVTPDAVPDALDASHERHVLLENTATGVRAAWVVSRGAITNAFGLGTLELEWKIGGAGDFDSDGNEDVLWQHTASGARAVWLMNGAGGVRAAVSLGVVPTDWRIAGAGDYDNDGKDDILWEHTGSGARAVWVMNGTGAVTTAFAVGTVEPQWRMTAAGDLDGDGTDDVLLKHADGRVVLWLMSGGRPVNAVVLGTMSLDWAIGGTGDLDGDGNEDVLWQSTSSGVRAVWLMNGAGRVVGAPVLTVESTAWHVAAVLSPVTASPRWDTPTASIGPYWSTPPALRFILYGESGDFNGDGLADIVVTSWTHSSNSQDWTGPARNPPAPVRIYLQKGSGGFEEATSRLAGQEVFAYAQQPLVADLNRDGVDDIVLPGFADLPAKDAPGVVLVSSGGGFVRRELRPDTWVHGASLADVDRDGCIDLVTATIATGLMRGDCAGGFVSTPYAPNGPGWVIGTHTCVADFDGDGRPDLVVPDAYTSHPRPLQDNVVYEMDWRAATPMPTALHRLPMPVWDRGNTNVDAMRSHDQRCATGDLDRDGRVDVLVSATPWAVDGVDWKESSKIQVYLNRGNWNFEDISDRAFPGRSDLTGSSLTLFLRDLNGDGNLDLVYPADAWAGRQASQVWYGVGDGSFSPAPGIDWAALYRAANASARSRGYGSISETEILAVIPVRRADGRYDFAVPVVAYDAAWNRAVYLEFARVGWRFR